MSRRAVSLARKGEVADAVKHGYATECIRERCVCWKVCSNNGKDDPMLCTTDLATGHYKRYEKEEGYYLSSQVAVIPHERSKTPRTNVFKKNKKK